jgi:glycosyltransferase involved in cell wall biosynthesis
MALLGGIVDAYDGGVVRVLAVVNNFPVPGSIDGVFNLLALRALQERGHAVRVVRFLPWLPALRKRWDVYRDVPGSYSIDGIAVRTLRALIGPKNRGLASVAWQLRGAMARQVEAFDPDIVQVHGVLPAGLLASDVRAPIVVTGHGSDTYSLPFLRPSLETLAAGVIERAAACVGVSAFIASKMKTLGAKRPRVIFNGADDRIFFQRDREAARAALQLDPRRPVILFAARMVPEKGLAELREAVLALRDLRPQVVLAGPGDRGNTLFASTGIDVYAPGVVSHEELATLLAACDVFALPSHKEGLPVVLCEAMNAHRAIVATDVGGISEIVHDGESGFVIAPHNAASLARHLRLVLEDAHLRRMFERAAGAFAAKHLTWQANARAYEALYDGILRSRARISA